ncbi:MAG: hypothetical protein ACAI35_23555, partial [Candidatus Methylacidiphilales bacterium]
MNKKSLNAKEKESVKNRAEELAKRLENHPELLERMEALMDIAQAPFREGDGGMDVDAIEDRVVGEVRKLGQQTMEQWAAHAEEQV